MQRLYDLLIMLSCVQVLVAVSRNIFIAKNEGNDKQSCGTSTNPCESLQFAIETISTTGEDMIFLDGGTVNPSVYDIDKSIVLERDLNLRKCECSLLNPIISYSGASTLMTYAFVMPRNASLSVAIYSVDFSNVGTVFCNASKECNITMLNSSSKVNNRNLTTRSQISLHNFLFSHLLIKNCSFEHTAFAMYAYSERTSSLRVSIVDVLLTNSTIKYQLKAVQGKVYGEIHKLTATYSSYVFMIAPNLHLNLSNSLFFCNKYDKRHGGVLVKLISFTRSNELFVRISNVQFYNNTRYHVLIEVTGDTLKKNSRLKCIIENIHAVSNELYGYHFAVVKTSTSFVRLRNITIRSIKHSGYEYILGKTCFSIKAQRFNVTDIELSDIDYVPLISSEGDGIISNIRCTSSNLKYGLTIKSVTNVKIMNVILIDISWTDGYLFLLRGIINMIITNVSISHNRNMKQIFVLESVRNISINNISIRNSSGPGPIFKVEDSKYIQIQNINVEYSEIGELFRTDIAKNLTIRNLYIAKNIMNSCFHFKHLQNSIVIKVVIKSNTIKCDLLTLINSNSTLISNWTISRNNISRQVINISCCSNKCIEFLNLKIFHNMVLESAISVNFGHLYYNYPKSTFHGMHLRENDIKKYVFEIGYNNNFILTSTYIEYNTYETCIYATSSLITMRDVNIKENRASGYVKETHFVYVEHVRAGATVTLSNVSITTSEVRSTVSSNDINFWELLTNISVVMENVNINVLPFQTLAWRMKLFTFNDTVIAPDYKVHCPRGSFNIHKNTRIDYGFQMISLCTVCEKGTYNLYGTSFRVNESKVLRTVNHHTTADSGCRKCPYGGVCVNGSSISRGNFFGFESDRSQLTYIPCPLSYCCSEDTVKCTDRNTCSLNRKGTLCGDCIPGYHENVFGTSCSKISDCISQIGFWAFHSLAAALLLFMHCFMDCVGIALSSIAGIFYKCFHQCRKVKKKDETKYTDSKSGQASTSNDGNRNNGAYRKQTSEPNNSDLTSSIQSDECLTLENRADVDRSLQLNSSVQLSVNETTIFTKHSVTNTELSDIEIADLQTFTTIPADSSSYTISGIIQILISFYQIRSLIHIELKQENTFVVTKVLDHMINAKMFLDIGNTFCPYIGLDAVGKAFINNVTLGINMIFLLSTTYLFNSIYRMFAKRKPVQECSRMPFHCRLEVCYLRVLLFSYKNVATFCFLVLNCVSMGDKHVLYIKGTTPCFQSWQYLFIGFAFCWVLPFPFVLSYTYQMYRQKCITFNMLMLCVTLPPLTLFLVARSFCKPFQSFCQPNIHQLNALKQLFEEPYRLRNGKTEDYIFWEHFRMFQSLLISVVTTFFIDLLWRNMLLMPLILCFFLVYIKVRPLKKNLVVLYWMEIVSSLALCYHVLFNLFKAFLYVSNIPAEGPVQNIKSFVTYSEFVVSPVIVIVTYLLFIPVYKRIVNAVQREKVE